jgi:hypothetical protein
VISCVGVTELALVARQREECRPVRNAPRDGAQHDWGAYIRVNTMHRFDRASRFGVIESPRRTP